MRACRSSIRGRRRDAPRSAAGDDPRGRDAFEAHCRAAGSLPRATRTRRLARLHLRDDGAAEGRRAHGDDARLIADGFVRALRPRPGRRVLVAAPVGHAVGFVYGVQLALAPDVPWSCCRPGTPRLRGADRRAPMHLRRGATPFLFDVVEHAERHGAADAREPAGLPVRRRPGLDALLERARRALPQTDATAYYGTSECGGVTTCPPDAPEEKKLTTDGLPLRAWRYGSSTGSSMSAGRSSRVGTGVTRPGPLPGRRLVRDRRRGHVDADGYVRIGGRLDDGSSAAASTSRPSRSRKSSAPIRTFARSRLSARPTNVSASALPRSSWPRNRRPRSTSCAPLRRGGTREGQVAGARCVRPRASAFAERQAPANRAAADSSRSR